MDRRHTAALALIIALLVGPPSRAAEPDYAGMLLTNESLLKNAPASCDPQKAVTTFDMEQCAAVEFKKADGEMNKAYQAAVQNDGADRNKNLQAVQRLWLSFRNQECAWEASKYEGGTLKPVAMGNCLVDITRARTKTLQDDLNP